MPRSGGRRATPLYKRLHFPGTEDITNYAHISSSPLRTASLGNCCISSFRYGVSGSAWHCLASVEGATSWSEQRRPAHKVTASDSFRIKLKTMESKSTEEQHLPGLLVFLDLDGKCMGAYFMIWFECMTCITIKNNFKQFSLTSLVAIYMCVCVHTYI